MLASVSAMTDLGMFQVGKVEESVKIPKENRKG